MSEKNTSNLTPEEAWQRLVGQWSSSVKSFNSLSIMRLHFTQDRKLIRSSSLSGGVMPMPLTNETTTDVIDIAIKKNAVYLTLGASRLGRAGAVLGLRFDDENRITIEDGPTYTRDE